MNNFYRVICALMYGTIFLTIFLQPAFAQQKTEEKVNINIRNGTLEEIVQAVRKQTAVKIVFNQELLQKSPRQSFTAKNEPLKSVMKRLLKGTALTFVMADGIMVIAAKEQEAIEPLIINKVSGIVQDENKNPLHAVTVNITGSTSNTITNERGAFAMTLEEGKSLTFSSVGFQKKTIKPKPGEPITVTLLPESNEIEEVVVTGYQVINKRLSASSTFTIKGKDVKEAGVTNVVSMLQGKVPGLDVVNTSGSPNAIPSMRMRGTSTLIGNANPIIVVDGVVRENPNNLNPDNLMGVDPGVLEKTFLEGGVLAKGSLTGNSISGLNINDVESITFLKDAAATAIYGARAANGVIVITTKRGTSGKLQISYSSEYGTSRKPNYNSLQLMNSQERVRFSRELYEDGYIYPSLPIGIGYEGAFQDWMNKKINENQFQQKVADLEQMNTDWFDVLFRNTLNVGQHLSFSGGSEKTTFYSSVSYNDSKGSAKQDRLNDGGIRMGLDTDLSRKLKLSLKLDGGHRVSTGYYDVNPLKYALQTSRAISPSLSYLSSPVDFSGGQMPGLNFNILNEIDQTGSLLKDSRLGAVLDLKYLVFRGLNLSSSISGNIDVQNNEQYATERSYNAAYTRGYDFGAVVPGSATQQYSFLPFGGVLLPSNTSSFKYTVRNLARFSRTIFSENHQIEILAGHEISSSQKQGLNSMIPGYLRDKGESFALMENSLNLFFPKKENTVANFMSLFGSATYDYAGRYVLNGNIRTDASNRFGQYANQRFLPAWSISGRWNINAEKWLSKSKIISGLAVKASYGFQGNVISEVGPDLILQLPGSTGAVSPISNEYVLNIKSLPYPDLRWEKTNSVNLELDASLFDSFLNIGMAFYRKLTTDAIITKDIPLEYGISTMLINGGKIKNSGYEMTVGLTPIKTKDMTWRISINTGKNFNTLQNGGTATTDINNLTNFLAGRQLVEGQPLNTFYVFSFKGLDPETGVPLFHGIDDAATSNTLGSFINYIKPAGSKDAKMQGGLLTSVDYRAFSLRTSFSYKIGSKTLRNPVYDSGKMYIPAPEDNLPAILTQRWRRPGDEVNTIIPAYPRTGNRQVYVSLPSEVNRYYMYDHSDVNVVSGSYLRCNSINLSYRLAESLVKRMNLQQVSLSGAGANLFVVADKKLRGQDPEIAGVGKTALPISKIFTLSLNVTF